MPLLHNSMATYKNILGSLVNYYDSSSDAAIVALRTALGSNQLWTGQVPETLSLPYCSVIRIITVPESQGKDNSKRVDRVAVSFAIYADDLAEVDSLLELLETAYLAYTPSDLAARTAMCYPVMVSKISQETDERSVYQGIFEVSYLLEKNPI